MEREIFADFEAWKARSDRKPLVLLGARQVGKTWAMREFGRKFYESVAYVNCDEEPLAKALFADYDIRRILLALRAVTGVNIEPGKTLVILDEIQEAPRGLHALKYFQENAPEYHVMAAGSLLGISLGRAESFPVGKVDMLHLGPMNFDEFLKAAAGGELSNVLDEGDWETVNVLAPKYKNFLREYYLVGGMPEVVAGFIEEQNLEAVRRRQEAILEAYRNDFSKHTSKSEAVRISQVFSSLPAQLAKENKKFIYGLLRSGARAASYELAIEWLVDAGIVHKVPLVREIREPLKFYEDASIFKLYLLDCGLFACLAGANPAQILAGEIFTEFKGAFTEQFVLQQLVSLGMRPYYWSNPRTPAEIDFVVEAGRVIPVEVKAASNVRSRSLSTYINSHSELALKGLRISMQPYKDQGWMENVPLYGVRKFFKELRRGVAGEGS